MNPKYKIAILLALTLISLPINFVLFYGPIFLISTPFFLILTVVLFFLPIPVFYSRFCIGFIMEFAVINAILSIIEHYYHLSVLISLLIGSAALLLIVSSLAQLLFGEKIFSRRMEFCLNMLAIAGFIFAIIFDAYILYI